MLKLFRRFAAILCKRFVSFWFGFLFLFSGLLLLRKKKGLKHRKKIRVIHKYSGYLLVIMILFHAIVNGSWIAYMKPWGVIILALLLASYVFLVVYPKIRKMI